MKYHKCTGDDWAEFGETTETRTTFELKLAKLKEQDVLYCLDAEHRDNDLEIFGQDDTEDFRRIEINLMACQPTATQQCRKTKKEMLDYLGPLDFLLVYTSEILAPADFEHPVNRRIKVVNQQIDYEKPNFIHSRL